MIIVRAGDGNAGRKVKKRGPFRSEGMHLVRLPQRGEQVLRQTQLGHRKGRDAVVHGVVAPGLPRVAGVLAPLAGEREIDVLADTHAERIGIEQMRPLFANPLGTREAHARPVTQRERAPPARRKFGGNFVEVAESAGVVPQKHRRRRSAGLAVDENGAAALRGETDAFDVVPTVGDLLPE